MRTIQYVETDVSDLRFGYWNAKTEEFVPIDATKTSELEAAAKKLGCSELLVEALAMFAENVREMVSSDLTDIWKRLD